MKTEEKKREAARPKANVSTPTTPAQDTPTPTQTRTPTEQPPANDVADGQAGVEPKTTDSVPPSGAADSEGPSAAEPKPDVDAQPKEVGLRKFPVIRSYI